jgi:hypothetical protein
MKRASKILFASTALTLFIGFPATAHHNGATYFDTAVEIEHTGATVVVYDLVNPHGRLVYTFADEDGNEVEWSGELPSANNVRRRGLDGELFKPGDKLSSVTGAPSRSGANFMRLSRVVFANGDIAQITGRNAGILRAGSQ